MNGLKYIREKSNFTKNALADRMGVTRQTVTLWEKGVRRPDAGHLKWLCDFYGVEEKWFGELSEDDMKILKKKWMFRHYDGDKEYFTFIPEKDGFSEMRIECGVLEAMLDDCYADTLKKKKAFMERIERYLEVPYTGRATLFDKILVAERGMRDIEEFLDLMDLVDGVGRESTVLKVPFRYEIKAALYAMMAASGLYTAEEVRAAHPFFFLADPDPRIEEAYFDQLVEMTSRHWNRVREKEMGKLDEFRKSRRTS
ncbi:MAG: helix-turn-helix transcriptional regulator [Lachnospiraceae bacterium]|nr:helix-turn-helix transcriptional regulator [Lachnospiraceae bacterium]